MSEVTLYQGDCLEVMGRLPDGSVDAVITDPPFTMAGGLSNGRTSTADSQFFAYWWRDVARELDRIVKPAGEGFIWLDWKSAVVIAEGFNQDQRKSWRLAQMLYHYREMPGMGRPFRSSVDMIGYLRGPKSKGHRIPNTTHNLLSKYWYYGKHPFHPAEKDPELIEQLLEWCSDEGDVVLDPFMGSGTTGVACVTASRRFVGIELDRDYFSVAQGRLGTAQAEASQLELAV